MLSITIGNCLANQFSKPNWTKFEYPALQEGDPEHWISLPIRTVHFWINLNPYLGHSARRLYWYDRWLCRWGKWTTSCWLPWQPWFLLVLSWATGCLEDARLDALVWRGSPLFDDSQDWRCFFTWVFFSSSAWKSWQLVRLSTGLVNLFISHFLIEETTVDCCCWWDHKNQD